MSSHRPQAKVTHTHLLKITPRLHKSRLPLFAIVERDGVAGVTKACPTRISSVCGRDQPARGT